MIYKKILRPVLFRWDSETIHDFLLHQLSLNYAWLDRFQFAFQEAHPALAQMILNLKFANPVGLAAGFDKYAKAVPAWHTLGFGFAEIGTITAQAQTGNDKPRVFRLKKDEALINRFGSNNDGARRTAETLQAWEQKKLLRAIPLGVNIGKTKVVELIRAHTDYEFSFEQLWKLADYFTVNVSSPNTPNLRELQDESFLQEILQALAQTNRRLSLKYDSTQKPILVKIAPDLTFQQVDSVLGVVEKTQTSGILATNTTIRRDHLCSNEELYSESGGLSGKPLKDISTEMISHIYKSTGGKFLIVGAGGIFSGDDAYEKIKAGASLVQIYTGFIYEGPLICKKINRRLVQLLERDGFKNISEAVGTAHNLVRSN